MILIAHRGNVNGPDPKRENSPKYIQEALDKGYDVEIDVSYLDGKWMLGHDKPTYETTTEFLKNPHLWCHAKNIDGLNQMLKNGIHCFFHDKDTVILTSKGYMWTYPGNKLTDKSICVMPEWEENENVDKSKCVGICSDNLTPYTH
jgi:hypothetical protein